MSNEPTLAELLAYPTRTEDVSATSLLRYLLVQARVLEARVADEAAIGSGLRRAAGEYAMAFAATHLLRALRAHPEADAEARLLWESWEDGANMGELLYEWLSEEGIDPEQVQRAYESARRGDGS